MQKRAERELWLKPTAKWIDRQHVRRWLFMLLMCGVSFWVGHVHDASTPSQVRARAWQQYYDRLTERELSNATKTAKNDG